MGRSHCRPPPPPPPGPLMFSTETSLWLTPGPLAFFWSLSLWAKHERNPRLGRSRRRPPPPSFSNFLCYFSRRRSFSRSLMCYSSLLPVLATSGHLNLFSPGPLLVGTSPRFRCQSSSRLYLTSHRNIISSGPLHDPSPPPSHPLPLPPPTSSLRRPFTSPLSFAVFFSPLFPN